MLVSAAQTPVPPCCQAMSLTKANKREKRKGNVGPGAGLKPLPEWDTKPIPSLQMQNQNQMSRWDERRHLKVFMIWRGNLQTTRFLRNLKAGRKEEELSLSKWLQLCSLPHHWLSVHLTVVCELQKGEKWHYKPSLPGRTWICILK